MFIGQKRRQQTNKFRWSDIDLMEQIHVLYVLQKHIKTAHTHTHKKQMLGIVHIHEVVSFMVVIHGACSMWFPE